MTKEEEIAINERFYREHKKRHVLCDDDGTEIADVPDDKLEDVAEWCRQSRTGFVKRIWETLDGKLAAWHPYSPLHAPLPRHQPSRKTVH